MPSSSAARVARWVDVVSQLLEEPLATFPVARIAEELAATFEVTAVSWDWRCRGDIGFQLYPARAHPVIPPSQAAAWASGGLLTRHRLTRWYAATGCTGPQTTARVPESVGPRRLHEPLREVLLTHSMEQQLTLICHLQGDDYQAFVLSRPGDDFSEEDLEVAGRLQPLLAALHRQARLAGGAPRTVGGGAGGTLTGREVAVLHLVYDGCTAEAVAHRLMISPRTVEKHLENAYRKLGVVDRVSAVRVATAEGLLSADTGPSTDLSPSSTPRACAPPRHDSSRS